MRRFFLLLACRGSLALTATRRGFASIGCGAAGSLCGDRAIAKGTDDFPLTNEGSGKGTILTSRPLEWLRVRGQLDADNALGELADPNQTSSDAVRLAAVYTAFDKLAALKSEINRGRPGWAAAQQVLFKAPFEKKAFKRVFNAYSDNVYYEKGDADRANLYLLGGTPPSTKQTIQYMHRNDALDNIELLAQELDYLLTDAAAGDDVEDALEFHAKATSAFEQYFALAPAEDRTAARVLLSAQ
ncbi:hypothetical protein M885DRAFT_522396 [Pelagophyceae sp. CCMP2097]|nr:hypothetical protein M885DRAFT_522396 [Pelagophyceae sp. CCMP2097]